MGIQTKEAFETQFKLNAIYERESRIRKNNILEFSETAGIYFNIVTNSAWQLWQEAKAQVTESNALLSASLDAIQKLGSGDFVLVPKEPTLEMCHHGRNTQSFKVQDIYKAMIEAQEPSND